MSYVEHSSRRLIVALPESYDDARTRYEQLAPVVDSEAFAAAHTWQEVLAVAERNAPYGFMVYFRGDVTAAVAGSPSQWQATQYLMGNHTIAETMFRHDPSVMLHAPLRTVIYTDPSGATKLTVDQPSLLFASYGNPDITAVGEHLDALLARLIELLGAEVPASLKVVSPPRQTSRSSTVATLATATSDGAGERLG